MHWIFYTFFVKSAVEAFLFQQSPLFRTFCGPESSVVPSMSFIFRQRLLRSTTGFTGFE